MIKNYLTKQCTFILAGPELAFIMVPQMALCLFCSAIGDDLRNAGTQIVRIGTREHGNAKPKLRNEGTQNTKVYRNAPTLIL